METATQIVAALEAIGELEERRSVLDRMAQRIDEIDREIKAVRRELESRRRRWQR